MGTTTRFSLRYPELTDEPDGPAQIGNLASDVEGWLSRLFGCTSSTRPTGVPTNFIARETDTGNVIIWTGSTWVTLGGEGGGGGSGGGRFTAEGTGQQIAATVSGQGTIVAFGSLGENTPDPTLVERTTQAGGHKFELASSGLWAVHASARVAANAAAGEMSLNVWADLAGGTSFEFNVAPDGGRREGLPRTLNAGTITYLPAGTTLAAFVYNGTGSQRQLEPASGDWVHLDLFLVA